MFEIPVGTYYSVQLQVIIDNSICIILHLGIPPTTKFGARLRLLSEFRKYIGSLISLEFRNNSVKPGLSIVLRELNGCAIFIGAFKKKKVFRVVNWIIVIP